jgi:hypothetical protein
LLLVDGSAIQDRLTPAFEATRSGPERRTTNSEEKENADPRGQERGNGDYER